MTHEEFIGVTFNDLDPPGTRIWRSSEFFVVISTEIALYIPHRAHIFTWTWLRDALVFAIANPSVCRLSVLNVCVPYSGGWSFRQYFFIVVYFSYPLTSLQNFTEILPGKPLSRGVKRKRCSKIERWWTYRRLYLINGTSYGIGYS